MEERETEAALYNAKLYDSEQKESDWYVERKLLLHKVEKLEGEIRKRDQLDSQIETCVASMFERQQSLEQSNADLTAHLRALGVDPSSSDSTSGAAAATATIERMQIEAPSEDS
eukprot:7699260-Pyramimonas_sp.AAC.1